MDLKFYGSVDFFLFWFNQDVNNFDPVITVDPATTVTLLENVAVGTTVVNVDATDNDPAVSLIFIIYFFFNLFTAVICKQPKAAY